MNRMCRTVAVMLPLILILTAAGAFGGSPPSVLFDEGHGQRFLIAETGPLHLASFAEMFAQAGLRVSSTSSPLTPDALAHTDILVISGPFHPYSAEEAEALARFVEEGGRLAMMLHIGIPLDKVLTRLGVDYTTSVIHEREEVIDGDPLNFRVTRLTPHPLTANLEHFSMYGVWAVRNTDDRSAVIARTSDSSWVDLNGDGKLSAGDAVQSFGVVVAGAYGKGRFVVFGDDAVFQNRFLDADNRRLAANLIGWLK